MSDADDIRSLSAKYYKTLAENCHLLAELWKTDPQAYGADAESIAAQEGMSEAYKKVADDLGKEVE